MHCFETATRCRGRPALPCHGEVFPVTLSSFAHSSMGKPLQQHVDAIKAYNELTHPH